MQLTGLSVVAPSTVSVGGTFSLAVKVLTEPYFTGAACFQPLPGVVGRYNASPRGIRYMDNVLPEFGGSVRLSGGDGYEGPATFSFSGVRDPYAGDRRPIARIGGLRFTTPGVRFIRVREQESGIEGISNAIEVRAEPPTERLYWGDLHSQTFFSDGLRCPEELYAFARDEGFLDLFALSDHAEALTDRQWEYFTAVTNDFHRDGSFVTLVGLEWTSHKFGHRNVYYPGDTGPILRPDDPEQGRLETLYEVARRESALVIPHHSANATMGVDWSHGHDPQVERLVEIHSVWGNSECPADAGNPLPIAVWGGERSGQHVWDALNRGYRLGFTGGGDIHDGRPGDELHNRQTEPGGYAGLRRQGIMGVWAADLTRAAVFDALRRRAVYATTNVRVPLRFSVNGHRMGSEIRAGGPRVLQVWAASECEIARVEMIRNGEVAASVEPNATEVRWDVEDGGDRPVDWYYARLRRADGQMAWSSPVWVERG
jgi:hypothetical protein